jgi:S1-C subfamily serine protease
MALCVVVLAGFSIHTASAGDSDAMDQPEIAIDRALVIEGPIEPTNVALESVVAVSATKCGDIAAGTGFLVGGGFVVTAAHIADQDATIAMLGAGNPTTSGPAQLATSSDLAVAAHEMVAAGSLRLAAHDPEPGTPVAMLGVERGGRLAVHAGEVTVRGKATDYGLDGTDLLVVDRAVPPGHSGGPVLDAEGFVVGVIAAGESRTATTLITPVSELRSMIGDATPVDDPTVEESAVANQPAPVC